MKSSFPNESVLARFEALEFPTEITHVYNPLRYAAEPHAEYLRRFASGTKRVLFLGMNPGPWGMAQTGVPFGEVAAVRDWMGICARVESPRDEHPKRPIQGFDCPRSEVSGRRLWALMRERFGDADTFFAEHTVLNYCPLVFMTETGKNFTPDKLPSAVRKELHDLCDALLLGYLRDLQAEHLVGVGKYAEAVLARLVDEADLSGHVSTVLHPSPASPAANRGWAEQATAQLLKNGVW